MNATILPFKAKNKRHDTELEFKEDCGQLVITVDMAHNGRHEMGIAFFLDKQQEIDLFNWMLARRAVQCPRCSRTKEQRTECTDEKCIRRVPMTWREE